jgi:NAD-dependent SIR2 family protein deacetylase
MRSAGDLVEFLARGRRIVALTGAGISTDSGIPDYRDAAGAWKRRPPMHFQEFVGSRAARQRYWARAAIGWRLFSQVEPNPAHHAFARLEAEDRVAQVITQNVDGLHQRAGSRRVIDLHGRVDATECLGCHTTAARTVWQRRLELANPGWTERTAEIAPDGDADLDGSAWNAFVVPACEHCSGIVKPAVVFFGESVPRARVAAAMAALDGSDGLLVAGTSLMIASGYRFIRAARGRGIPIALVNVGRTRADAEVDVRIEGRCEVVLPQVLDRLGH